MDTINMSDPKTYYFLRDQFDSSFLSRLSHRQRLFFHPLIRVAVKVRNKIAKLHVKVLYNHRTKTDKPKIFAITHIGKYDIEVITALLPDHYYLLSGDYEHICGSPEEKLLAFNGVVWVKKDDRDDRRQSKERMIEVLRNGGNLMYFPEGAWNLTPHMPVLQCPYGIIDVAMRGNAEIVPIGIEQYGKDFIVAFGENFDVSKYSDEDKLQAIGDLRDVLATLKWDIWESLSKEECESINAKTFAALIEQKLAEWTAPASFFEKARFKPKNISEEKDVYRFLSDLTLADDNAFLAKAQLEYAEKYT